MFAILGKKKKIKIKKDGFNVGSLIWGPFFDGINVMFAILGKKIKKINKMEPI
jgi:hypothetical protein